MSRTRFRCNIYARVRVNVTHTIGGNRGKAWTRTAYQKIFFRLVLLLNVSFVQRLVFTRQTVLKSGNNLEYRKKNDKYKFFLKINSKIRKA